MDCNKITQKFEHNSIAVILQVLQMVSSFSAERHRGINSNTALLIQCLFSSDDETTVRDEIFKNIHSFSYSSSSSYYYFH